MSSEILEAPDPVVRTGLDEYLITGAEQERPQVFVLAELCHVPLRDELTTARLPNIVVEVLHCAAERLGLARVGGRQELVQRLLVSKQPRLGRLHPVFGG